MMPMTYPPPDEWVVDFPVLPGRSLVCNASRKSNKVVGSTMKSLLMLWENKQTRLRPCEVKSPHRQHSALDRRNRSCSARSQWDHRGVCAGEFRLHEEGGPG